MIVTYSSWWRKKKKAQSNYNTITRLDSYNDTEFAKQGDDNNILEKASKYAHENRKIYFLTVYNGNEPINFIEINNDFITIGFLDSLKRHYLSYNFYEMESNKLFLKEAQFWEYESQTDKRKSSTQYLFSQDGSLKIIESNLITGTSEVKEAKNKIDVSKNIESYPKFGQYEHLIVKERISEIN